MNTQTVHIDVQCLNPKCKGFNYFEDETGYYVCADCNTISQIRCGLELDYTFPIRTSKIVKNDEDDVLSDEGAIGENIEQDIISQKFSFDADTLNISTTNVLTSRLDTSKDISSIISSKKGKTNVLKKTPIQKLIEIQIYFENIINTLINDFFDKNNNIYNLKNNYFNNIINFGENEKKFFYDISRKIWIYFLAKKYKNIANPIYRRKKLTSLIRSRKNSIDNDENGGICSNIPINNNNYNNSNNIGVNHNNINNKNKINVKIKKKKKIKNREKRLHEQIKMRRITERNVYKLYGLENTNILLSNFSFGENNKFKFKNNNKNNFYNENNFSSDDNKKKMLKRFIEEYDQVINFIKKDKCFDIIFESEEEKEKINITNVIEYEQLIKVCEELGINTKNENNNLIKGIRNKEEDLNYEELIHLIFNKQQLNYININIYDNDNNNIITNGINSNHFLFLIYEIFHYNKIPLLINDILFNYKNFFYINKLTLEEINFLFLLNFKKFKSHINWFDNQLDENNKLKKAESIIDKINIYILKMPDIFNFLYKYILKRLHDNEKLKLIITTKNIYIIEYVCIGIILFCLKIIYGLNDLPYMCLLLNNINKKYFDYNNDIDLKEHLNTFIKNTKNDKLCQIYTSFPSELDLINILINEIKNRNNNSLIIENKERKINYNKEYKNKYIDSNMNYLYKNIYDDFTQDINDLEKKYIKNIKNKNIKNKNIKNKGKKTWKICKTKIFEKKIENIENPIKQFNPFIEEEFNFHEGVYKNKDTNVEFPLPFDTYIRMKRHSQKILINYHRPSEMMFIYLFSEFFKIDYLSLRTITRLVEYYIEKIYIQ